MSRRFGQVTDIASRVAVERDHLLNVLDGLDEPGWATQSLCQGWTVRDVVVHVLMPYEMQPPEFGERMQAAGGDFDRMADAYARADTRVPAELVTALRETPSRTFNVPGPPTAELSHLLIHAQDVYRPLGIDSPTDPESARLVLDEIARLREIALDDRPPLDQLVSIFRT
jgi:uncharacterized protein (TIGR03083 family)